MNKVDIPFASVAQLSQLIQKREISPVDVIEAYLERVGQLDRRLNAYITVCSDQALKVAGEAEQAIMQGRYLGPMHGIPVAVKDQLCTKGIRTTYGSKIFEDYTPEYDATVISNLKNAGAILLGKLNMSEFAWGFYHGYGAPRNPWDLERQTGISSSGSGAATAAFLCATSLGEDTGGSVRFPAAWCGLVGLRPSWGLVSRYGLMPGVWSMDTVGPISRTVEDCAITLQAIAGYDTKDRYTCRIPVPDYKQELESDLKGVRIGIVKETFYSPMVADEVRKVVGVAIKEMGNLVSEVEEISIPLSTQVSLISAGLRVEAPARNSNLMQHRFGEMGWDNQVMYMTGSLLGAQLYYKSQKLRSMLRNQVLCALDKVDVLVSPAVGVVAQKIESESTSLDWLFTQMAALVGIPALSICCGFTDQNLPVSLEIAGRPFQDPTVLKLAHAYERTSPWHTRKPPI